MVYHRSQYSCSVIKLPRLSSFEGLCLQICTPVLLSVYRPGSCQPSQLFYDELDSVLESLVVHGCPVIIGGDFNIHVEDQTNHDATLLAWNRSVSCSMSTVRLTSTAAPLTSSYLDRTWPSNRSKWIHQASSQITPWCLVVFRHVIK